MATRRRFLSVAARSAPALGCVASLPRVFANARLDEALKTAPAARFWTSVEAAGANCAACHSQPMDTRAKPAHAPGLVQCLLCAQRCAIAPGERGRCRARLNVAGKLKSLVYGRPVAIHVDPIEKKPLYHFLPGARAFSFGTAGCPLSCQFCQNWELSQSRPEDHEGAFVAPAPLVEAAAREAAVIAFTYNEPTVFAEYLLDVARAGLQRGLRSVLVSCGFMNEAPLDAMCDVLAGIKIDLKGFNEAFYRDVSHAELKPVLRSIAQVRRRARHLEIVNLVVPTLNDSDAMLDGLAAWVVRELGPDVPVHFTRFHPDYKLLNLPPTPVATLERAREMARARGIHYAYVGNVPGHAGNHTYCPKCGAIVLRRSSFFVVENNLWKGQCKQCRHPIPGVWS